MGDTNKDPLMKKQTGLMNFIVKHNTAEVKWTFNNCPEP